MYSLLCCRQGLKKLTAIHKTQHKSKTDKREERKTRVGTLKSTRNEVKIKNAYHKVVCVDVGHKRKPILNK